MTDKTSLRAAARARRKTAFETVDLSLATKRLMAALDVKRGPMAFYWPIRTEIDPRPVMDAKASESCVCLPVTHGHGPLSFREWKPGLVLAKDSFGTEYPATGPDILPKTLVVPMLAFDRRGHRLGYGAGHYDRTLSVLLSAGPITTIGYAYAAQEIPRVPDEPTDQPLDMIVTETETIMVGSEGPAPSRP